MKNIVIGFVARERRSISTLALGFMSGFAAVGLLLCWLGLFEYTPYMIIGVGFSLIIYGSLVIPAVPHAGAE
jgi:apolipoprotein N-acyltransferase